MALRARHAGLSAGAEAEAAAAMMLGPDAKDRSGAAVEPGAKDRSSGPRVRLPLLGGGVPEFRLPRVRPLPALAQEADAAAVWVVAPDLAAARACAAQFPDVPALELEL